MTPNKQPWSSTPRYMISIVINHPPPPPTPDNNPPNTIFKINYQLHAANADKKANPSQQD